MEDYEYLTLLKKLFDAYETKKASFAVGASDLERRVSELLMVVAPLAGSMQNFTKDSTVLQQRRDAIARAIEELSAALNQITK
jgi:hypothetical protein